MDALLCRLEFVSANIKPVVFEDMLAKIPVEKTIVRLTDARNTQCIIQVTCAEHDVQAIINGVKALHPNDKIKCVYYPVRMGIL